MTFWNHPNSSVRYYMDIGIDEQKNIILDTRVEELSLFSSPQH